MPHVVSYNGEKFTFTKKDLLENREFDSGIFAFRADKLAKHIGRLRPNNVQKEIYLTDIVNIFINAGLTVGAAKPANSEVLLGFNNKSTLDKMEAIARRNYYEILKDIITIEDNEKFFIAEEVIKGILRMDKTHGPLDMVIGDGCYVSSGVGMNNGVSIGRGAVLDGNIKLGKNVKIGDGTRLLTYPDQTMKIGDSTEILEGNLIKGNVTVGSGVRIETGVHITGSYDYPTTIGDRCVIKGTTYIYGAKIEEDNWILHSIITQKTVQKIIKKDGSVQRVKYILPLPEGIDSIRPL